MPTQIAVLVSHELYDEVVRRKGTGASFGSLLEHAFADFLDRTEDDYQLWSEEYQRAREIDRRFGELITESERFEKEFGPVEKGYSWDRLLLPNGTQLLVEKRDGTRAIAQIKHGQVRYEDSTGTEPSLSPSQFANTIKGHNCNAWLHVKIKLHGSDKWILANQLRIQSNGKIINLRRNIVLDPEPR